MNFIKLTDSEDNTTIYVNIATICSILIYQDEDRPVTIVALDNGQRRWVLEKPEEFLEMIENTINKNNNKH